jgi:sugar O-acyltransferase (sialic acid O-acetyltransferase NeuD family)
MNDKPKVFIWGAGGHARVVWDIVEQAYPGIIFAGWIDDVNEGLWGTVVDGYPVLGGSEQLSKLRGEGVNLCVAAIGDCQARDSVSEFVVSAGFRLLTAVHPSAQVAATASLGQGTVVAANAVVAVRAILGRSVIVNHGATVDHDCLIGDSSHICPGVNLAGHVRVGNRSWLGIGCSVKENVSIGSEVIVGAGSVVLRNIPDGALAFGVPAKMIDGRSKR